MIVVHDPPLWSKLQMECQVASHKLLHLQAVIQTRAPTFVEMAQVLQKTAVHMAATFDPRKTKDIQSWVVQWRDAPIAGLLELLGPGYRYGYIGTEDRAMCPLIVPGAIVQRGSMSPGSENVGEV